MSADISKESIDSHDSVILTDDNSQMSTFRGSFGQLISRLYLGWYLKKVESLCRSLTNQKKSILVVGNGDFLAKLRAEENVTLLAYDEILERIDFEVAGRLSSELSEKFENLFEPGFKKLSENSDFLNIWKVSFVQSAFLFCFYSAAYSEMFKRLFQTVKRGDVWLISCFSELEKTASALLKKNGEFVHVQHPHHVLTWGRQKLFDWLYLRDRKNRVQNLKPERNELKNAIQVQPVDVLLAVCHSLQLKTAIPVIKTLLQKGVTCHLVMSSASQSDKTLLGQNNISWSYASSYLTEKEFADTALDNIHTLKDLWKKSCHLHKSKNTLEIDGVDFFQINQSKLQAFSTHSLTQANLCVRISKAAIEKFSPKLIIVFSDARFLEAAMALVGKSKNVRTLLLSPNPVMSADAINRYDTCDHVALVGQHIYERLKSRARLKEDQLHILGDIRFDSLKDQRAKFSIDQLHQDLGIDLKKKIVTLTSYYTTAWHPIEEKSLLFKKAAAALSAIENAVLVIKAHPNESEDFLKKLLLKLKLNNVIVVKNYSIYQLLMGSSFLISLASSMAPLEGMMLDIPVVSFDMSNKNSDKLFNYIKKRGAIGIDEKTDLGPLFEKLIHNQEFRNQQINRGKDFISYYITQPEGGVGNQIMKLIQPWLADSKNEKEAKCR